MEKGKEKKGNRIAIAAIAIAAVAVIGTLVYLLIQARNENELMQELFSIEKEELENEYTTFATQYDELETRILNDSLQIKLQEEKLKTQRLLEELRQTKATDAAEITRLKKELKTVREVLKSYVAQIDSLHTLNEQLQNENEKVKRQYTVATRQIDDLAKEKKDLSEKVSLASQLDATGISLALRRKNGKEAKKLKEAVKMAVSFTLTKNITAPTGEKTLYMRLAKPDGSVLTKSGGGTFPYENQKLEYSVKKYIEYNGEEQSVTLYWDIEEFLSPGKYSVYLFADGAMIGSNSFNLN